MKSQVHRRENKHTRHGRLDHQKLKNSLFTLIGCNRGLGMRSILFRLTVGNMLKNNQYEEHVGINELKIAKDNCAIKFSLSTFRFVLDRLQVKYRH